MSLLMLEKRLTFETSLSAEKALINLGEENQRRYACSRPQLSFILRMLSNAENLSRKVSRRAS